MNIKSFNSYNEGIDQPKNYMFFTDLKTIKRLVDELLTMDESKLDNILEEHNWALDHIATSKDDIEEVFNCFAGK